MAGVIFAAVIARLAFDRQTDAEPQVVAPATLSPRAAGSRDNAPAAPLTIESPSPSIPARRLISPPDGVRWARAIDDNVPNTILSASPDGRLLVYSGQIGDERALWLQSLTSEDVWRLPGTEGAISPFWSPDSTSIGFFADRMLKRLDLNGLGIRTRDASGISAPVTLTRVGSQRGGTWGPDNIIVFAPFPGGLKRISADGGDVTSLTSPDSANLITCVRIF